MKNCQFTFKCDECKKTRGVYVDPNTTIPLLIINFLKEDYIPMYWLCCSEPLFPKNNIYKLKLKDESWYNVVIETCHLLSCSTKIESILYSHKNSDIRVNIYYHCGKEDINKSKRCKAYLPVCSMCYKKYIPIKTGAFLHTKRKGISLVKELVKQSKNV